ncbi:hypothetical protein JYB64_25320, partial [Algoriphagus aestuarii]|nr:hypothetical protein [Algoriphagus aestuarii]
FQALTGQAASRLRIHGNGAFSTSSSRTAAGLMPDEIFDRTGTVSHNARGPPYGSGDETVVNYYQPQVLPLEACFQKNAAGDFSRRLDSTLHLVNRL